MEKVAAAAVAAALCAVIVRKHAPEIALVLILAASTIILAFCTTALAQVFTSLRELVEFGGISHSLITPVIKITGIAVITKVTAAVCRDAKEGGLASIVETSGTVLALVNALPLMTAVLSTMSELI